jgi:hypothetical protein
LRWRSSCCGICSSTGFRAWTQTGLLALAASAAVCLLVGYRTRLSTGVSVVLLASLYAWNPYVINGGNTILVVVLFVALALPLIARWSLAADRRRGDSDRGDVDERGADGGEGGEGETDDGKAGSDPRRCSVGTTVTLLTLVSIYMANAVANYRSDAWMSGAAVAKVFRLSEFVVRLGPFVATHAAVLETINWLWTALLSASVLLVAATGRLRTGVVPARNVTAVTISHVEQAVDPNGVVGEPDAEKQIRVAC